MSGLSGQRVLVVEDEPLIRMLAVEEMEELGLDVVEASDARHALELIQRNPGVPILFTDIDMPGKMNGIGLANEVRDRWPPIKIVITSGKWNRSVDGMPPDAEFVSKPYDCRQLSRYFVSLLDMSAPSISAPV